VDSLSPPSGGDSTTPLSNPAQRYIRSCVRRIPQRLQLQISFDVMSLAGIDELRKAELVMLDEVHLRAQSAGTDRLAANQRSEHEHVGVFEPLARQSLR
jgi:hypothetical protein